VLARSLRQLSMHSCKTPMLVASFSELTIAVMGPRGHLSLRRQSRAKSKRISARARRGLRTIRRGIKTTALTITAPTVTWVSHAFS